MIGNRFKFKEIYNFFISIDYTDGSIPSDIMYELHKCTQLTEEVFLKACRKVYRNHLKQLKKQTKIELLFIDSQCSGFDFSLCAARKENEIEEKIRLDKENAVNKFFKDNLKTQLKTTKKLDKETIDEMIKILEKKKEELQNE
jgi:hypothetical protein